MWGWAGGWIDMGMGEKICDMNFYRIATFPVTSALPSLSMLNIRTSPPLPIFREYWDNRTYLDCFHHSDMKFLLFFLVFNFPISQFSQRLKLSGRHKRNDDETQLTCCCCCCCYRSYYYCWVHWRYREKIVGNWKLETFFNKVQAH